MESLYRKKENANKSVYVGHQPYKSQQFSKNISREEDRGGKSVDKKGLSANNSMYNRTAGP